MRQLFIVLTLLLLTNHNLSANNTFKSGYIINLKGDTIQGYLLEQSSINASKRCIFKNTPEGDKLVYKPNDIFGYRFNDGKYYISKQIGSNQDQVKVTIFMEFLIKGIASIYYSVDEKGEHFYIEKTPFGLVELSDSDMNTYDDKKDALIYRGKLNVIMADCPEIKNEINNTQLNYTSLVKLSKDYHNRVCTTESCIIYEREATPVQVNFGIILGMSVNKYKFGSELVSDYRPDYQVGVSMRLKNVLFANDNLSIGIDLLFEKDSKYTMKPVSDKRYVHVSYDGVEYILTSFPLNYSLQELPVDLKIINLKIPVIVSYNFDFSKFSIVPGIGITNKFILSNNKEFKIENFEIQYGRTIRPYLIGLTGKVGLEKKLVNSKAVSLTILYEYLADPFAVNSLLRLTERKFTFQAGFRF
jgi:hypothetical protein